MNNYTGQASVFPTSRRRAHKWGVSVVAVLVALAGATLGSAGPVRAATAAPRGVWTKLTPTASPKFDSEISSKYPMAYDEARDNVVLFTGLKTWTWDGTTWTLHDNLPSSPSSRGWMGAMAYDAANKEVVLFGGAKTTGADYGDTWTWNGKTWTKRSPASLVNPPGRCCHTLAYYPPLKRVVMFGGASITATEPDDKDLGDTWVWDGRESGRWEPLLIIGPTPRYGAAMTYDAAREELVLFGGTTSARQGNERKSWNETWVFNGAAWTQRSTAVAPGPRAGHSLSYDALNRRTVLFSGSNYDNLPTSRLDGALEEDPYEAPPEGRYYDTWIWDGTTWTERHPNTPPGTYDPTMVYDAGRARHLVMGVTWYTNPKLGETWTYRDVDTGAASDFTGDAKADPTVFRPTNGNWHVKDGATTPWGARGDIPVAADYDGDGKDDAAVYRPSDHTWYVKGSTEGARYFEGPVLATTATRWGTPGDIPVPADYDRDGKADVAVYRPSDGTWYIKGSTGAITATPWGTQGDIPVVGDYDRDGKADVAVYRPSDGTWYVKGSTGAITATPWGTQGDVPVPADYDGDAKADTAVYRPSDGTWYVNGSTGAATATLWGTPGDVPVPADYGGDKKADVAMFRPSNGAWYVNGGSSPVWGIGGDLPARLPTAIVQGLLPA